jgi:hypothetical protein
MNRLLLTKPRCSSIHDAPRLHEIVLSIGYATGLRVNAGCKGPDRKEGDAPVASFASGEVKRL